MKKDISPVSIWLISICAMIIIDVTLFPLISEGYIMLIPFIASIIATGVIILCPLIGIYKKEKT